MRRIDELHLEYPFAGSRMMRGLLRQEGLSCGRRHIATLMRRMGIEALYRKPNTSRRRPGHTVYPYLLRGLEVSRPNQVWAMDITYIPMARGFVYLAAVTRSAPFMRYFTLASGAHTTLGLSGFPPLSGVPFSLTVYTHYAQDSCRPH